MMINLRKSRYQSHTERNYEAEVNKNFTTALHDAIDFCSASASRAEVMLRLATGMVLTESDSDGLRVHAASDAFECWCIYNDEGEIFAGA